MCLALEELLALARPPATNLPRDDNQLGTFVPAAEFRVCGLLVSAEPPSTPRRLPHLCLVGPQVPITIDDDDSLVTHSADLGR